MRARPALAPMALAAAVLVALTGCGGSSGSSSASATSRSSAATSSSSIPKGSGPVNVLYAGSLVNLMEKQVGPAFDKATGYTFTGFGAGSSALATQIKGKVRPGDVFISASPAVNDSLTGDANGNWVSWYATFATSALVVGYNPRSKFAADLTSKPWYEVLSEPGILVGTTDPVADPKGKLANTALTTAATAQNQPALAKLASDPSIIFPEETLVSRLQAGQLDVGFFYTAEAKAANIPTVPLSDQDLKATYTVTVLNQAPDEQGGEAFVQYLLGKEGLATLTSDGFSLTTPPTVIGSAVPDSLSTTVLSGK
jgi:molybdate/tungstate transport system substrate-binding protein